MQLSFFNFSLASDFWHSEISKKVLVSVIHFDFTTNFFPRLQVYFLWSSFPSAKFTSLGLFLQKVGVLDLWNGTSLVQNFQKTLLYCFRSFWKPIFLNYYCFDFFVGGVNWKHCTSTGRVERKTSFTFLHQFWIGPKFAKKMLGTLIRRQNRTPTSPS